MSTLSTQVAVAIAIVAASFVIGVAGLEASERLACTRGNGCQVDREVLSFLVVGDTGGLPPPAFTSYAQTRVASAMAVLAEESNASFVVNLGDNFYFNGVTDIKDTRFWRTFEDIYKAPELRMPWFTIAGNHDHLGNVSAQIMHTPRSHLWTFPSLYYTVRYTFGASNTVVDIIMIDTIELCGNCIDVDGADLVSWIFHTKLDPTTPLDPVQADKQWAWIEDQLGNSTADYLFVAGHYPVYSTSEHGPNTCLIARLDPLLRRYGVTAYLAGHDHNLQLLRVANDSDSTDMTYIVSGAGSRSDRSHSHAADVPTGAEIFRYPKSWNPFSQLGLSYGGFMQVSLDASGGAFNFYDGKGDHLHTEDFRPRGAVKVVEDDEVVVRLSED